MDGLIIFADASNIIHGARALLSQNEVSNDGLNVAAHCTAWLEKLNEALRAFIIDTVNRIREEQCPA